MIEIGAVCVDLRFDSGSVERLFAARKAALADLQGFWEREVRCTARSLSRRVT